MPTPRVKPASWAIVFGTVMVVLAFFDVIWGLATVALGEHLQVLAGALDERKLGMAFGRVVHFMTFGMLTLSGAETGEHAKDLLAMLPRPGYLVEVGWVRVGLSAIAVCVGFMLAKGLRSAPSLVLAWVVIALAWSAWSTARTLGLTTEGMGDPMKGESLPMFAVELGVHFVWPLLLGARCGLWIVSTRLGKGAMGP
jgi:hypothetical protein